MSWLSYDVILENLESWSQFEGRKLEGARLQSEKISHCLGIWGDERMTQEERLDALAYALDQVREFELRREKLSEAMKLIREVQS